MKLADVPCSQTQCPGMRKKDVVVPRMQVKFHNTRSRKRPLETEPLSVKKRSCPALLRSTTLITPTVTETDTFFDTDIANPIVTVTATPIVTEIAFPIETDIAAPIATEIAAPIEIETISPIEPEIAAPIENEIAAPIDIEIAAPIEDKIVAPIETEIADPIEEFEESLPPSTQLHTPTQQPNTYPPSQASVQHPPPPTTTPPPPLLLGADSPSAAGSRKDRTAPAD